MKLKVVYLVISIFSILFLSHTSLSTEDNIQKEASAYFPETKYEFDPVVDGEKIVHDFIIQNKGNAPLQIIKVKSG